jgi:hypothetical protein
MLISIATYWSICSLGDELQLGFARVLSNYATDVVILYQIFVTLAFVRYLVTLNGLDDS